MALFGEKYGDRVRVIQFGESVELCGGIHVSSTAQIGKFVILSESAVASGVRRIEAVTHEKANELIDQELHLLQEIRDLLKNPKDLKKQLASVLTQNHELSKKLEALQKEKSQGLKQSLLGEIQAINGVNFLAKEIDLDAADAIKDLAFQLKEEIPNLFLALGATINAKPNLTLVISENLVEEKGWNAGKIIRDLAKEIQGGGGGQAFYATAGGNKVEGIPAALKKASDLLH